MSRLLNMLSSMTRQWSSKSVVIQGLSQSGGHWRSPRVQHHFKIPGAIDRSAHSRLQGQELGVRGAQDPMPRQGGRVQSHAKEGQINHNN